MNQTKCFDEIDAEKVNRLNRKRLKGKEIAQTGRGKRTLNVLATLKIDTRASNGDKSESVRTGLILPCGAIKPEHVNLYHQNTRRFETIEVAFKLYFASQMTI